MSDIVEFLHARLEEDEALARAASHIGEDGCIAPWHYTRDLAYPRGVTYGKNRPDGVVSGKIITYWEEDGEHIAQHDPRRVLADVEFKREVIQYEQKVRTPTGVAASGLLRALAEVYVDHPDYQQEWAR